MPQSISPATLFAFLEVASVPVLQHKVIIYLNTAYWHTYPVFQQSEACGAFVGLKTSTMEASADKKARKSTSESEVEGGILGDFMGFKMNCESVFLFSFHPSLTSSPSSPGFYYCLSTSSAPPPPLVSSLALSSNSHGFLLPLFHFHPPHAWLCCLATSHLQTDDQKKSLWHPNTNTNCSIRIVATCWCHWCWGHWHVGQLENRLLNRAMFWKSGFNTTFP